MKPIQNISKDPIARGGVDDVKNPTFTEASTRENIASEESLPTLFGKIKKFFSDLKAVAFTNSYNDLDDKPTIPAAQIQSDWNQTTTTAKDYIKNKPTIPAAQVQTDWNATSGMGVLLNKPTNLAVKNSDNKFSANQTVDRANGTTSSAGDSAFLLGNNIASGTAGNSRGSFYIYDASAYRVRLRTNTLTADRNIALPNAGGTIALTTSDISGNAATATTATNISLPRVTESCNNLPSGNTSRMREYTDSSSNLPTSAFYHILESGSPDTNWGTQLALGMTEDAVYYRRYASGSWQSWSQLAYKSDIPTVNNAKLTIQKNGTTVKTFTANASSNVTCNITVPTKVSELTNDSNFIDDNGATVSGVYTFNSGYASGGNSPSACPVYIYAPQTGNKLPSIGFYKDAGSYSLILYMTVTGDLYARWNDGTEKKIVGH